MQCASPATWKGTALNCVMAKKANISVIQLKKIFEILLNRLGIRGAGAPSDDALRETEGNEMMKTIDKFLDDLEMLRRRSQPVESNRRMNLAVALKIHQWCEE